MDNEIADVGAEVVEAPETPVVETPKPTFEETMDRVAREVAEREPLKGPDGRFQSKVAAPGAPSDIEVPGKPELAAPEPARPAIEAPQSLSDAVKKAWSSLPPDVQAEWAKRESEATQKITTDGQRLKELSVFEEIVKPYEGRLKELGIPKHEHYRRLAQADSMLSADFERHIGDIYRMYGRTPPAAYGQTGQPDPSSALYSEIQSLKTELSQLKQAGEQAKLSVAEQRIEELKKGRPHLEKVADMMATFIEGKLAKTPEEAYDMAVKVHPEVSAQIAAEAKAEAEKKAAEEAKAKAARDAKISPLAKRPGSTPTAPLKGKSIWETIDRVDAEIRARA